jgi:hypothetical protein
MGYMTQNHSDYANLLGSLRRIASSNPNSHEKLCELQNDCAALIRTIKSLGLADGCPHVIWHYLADADIRFKDFDYARQQQAQFVAAIEEWTLSLEHPNNCHMAANRCATDALK